HLPPILPTDRDFHDQRLWTRARDENSTSVLGMLDHWPVKGGISSPPPTGPGNPLLTAHGRSEAGLEGALLDYGILLPVLFDFPF
ncbi:hypothetical protein RRG08_012190, partial [Elysia crispata]